MGQKEKLVQRLKSKPKDFTFQEAETLLGYLSYKRSDKGGPAAPVWRSLVMTMRRSCCISRIREKNFWNIKSSS